MSWQYTQPALAARSADKGSFAVVEFTFGSHYLDMQGVACRHSLTLLILCFVVLHNFFDVSLQIEVVFRNVVIFAFQDLFAPLNCFLHRDVSTFLASKYLRYGEGFCWAATPSANCEQYCCVLHRPPVDRASGWWRPADRWQDRYPAQRWLVPTQSSSRGGQRLWPEPGQCSRQQGHKQPASRLLNLSSSR